MYTLKVKNNRGDELYLTDSRDYTIYKIVGLDPPAANINYSENAASDGGKINSVKVGKRNIVLYIKLNGDIETNRIGLYKYFPIKKAVTLYFQNDSRDVYISGVVETLECNQFANPQVAQISIICADPYFKDINDMEIKLSDVTPLFEFPFSAPAEGIEFSRLTINNRKTIINTSDIDTGVIIELYASGTVVNPTLYDVLGGKHIKLNLTMQPADTIIINTNIDRKSITLIRAGVSSNALGYMRPDSKWFTLQAGDNVFTYDCDSGSANLLITFTASILYSGV